MIDSLMPSSDTSGLPTKRRSSSAKRTAGQVPRPCKKLKKSHSWSKKLFKDSGEKSSTEKTKCKNGKKLRKLPTAPSNTTQFIMDEHDQFNDSDLFSASVPPVLSESSRLRRDSTPSIESEDDNFSSSIDHAEEQDNYIHQEFWNSYNDINAERLHDLSKSQLVQEYFNMEDKFDMLERELILVRSQDESRQRIRAPSPGGEEIPPGEVPVDAETAAKIEVFRSEIEKLLAENDILRDENASLHRKVESTSFCKHCDLGCPSSNSSDDESSSSSSCSSCDSYDSESPVDKEEIIKRKLNISLSNISPPQGGDEGQINATVPPAGVTISELAGDMAVDFVSDSGIASASSGDDLRQEGGTRKIRPKINLMAKYKSSTNKLQLPVRSTTI